MLTNHKLRNGFMLLLFSLSLTFIEAASVKFPSTTQAGVAVLTDGGNHWEFSNNLFTAYFSKNGGKLHFGGSPEMSLESGNEIFEILLGNGTKVKASEMTWGAISSENLTGNTNAVKYSSQLPGKALKATLTYNNLTINWRAVLRDGAHYLRTEMEIFTTANTAMTSITPMLYTVKNIDGRTEPVVVGNTRGAVVASSHLFAGLETPLGINQVSTSYNPNFNVNSWKPESWLDPTNAVPTSIFSLGFNPSEIVVSQGEVNVSVAGTWTFKFQYESGTHRMNLTGVDLVNNFGTVVASDYHVGFTGNAASSNTYTLNIPTSGKYTLRYFGEIKTETITSSGSVTVSKTGASNNIYNPAAWTTNDWKTPSTTPSQILALGFGQNEIVSIEGKVNISTAGTLAVKFQYASGSHRMNLTGVDILDNTNTVIASDYHIGFTGGASSNNTYTLTVPIAGVYTLRYFGETKTETIASNGNISFTGVNITNASPTDEITIVPKTGIDPFTSITGKWSRNTTLQTTDTFRVSSVIGLIEPGQLRRSYLAYHERERAVPWRSFVLYNSWYELNINRNNDPDPMKRMTESQCMPILNTWKNKMYDTHGLSIDAFVWDDGWDNFNSLWNFHVGFPQGFTNIDAIAREQKSGIGAWLGPVGGYGSSKAQRLAYWNSTHSPAISNFQLSNKEYFDAFVGRCSQMVQDYDMRFFKFDGISDFFSATGPKNEEDAEGIIKVLSALRKKREDLFFNCTVGTWASPFWFHYGDAVWRQEDDFGTIGDQGNNREKWITYRDRLVYQNFVINSPICPINSLMTHGLMVTKFGPPATMPRDNSSATFKGIVKEMRCAFACGSSMVELYVDNDLMSTIGGNNKLWSELAKCITWHRNNADVLADTHWVGGNPWDGSKANIYGWASWNETKSTLTLRNPTGSNKSLSTTMRQALEIPVHITGKIRLTSAFDDQTNYTGITDQEIDIDTLITFNMPAFDVIVFNGATVGMDTEIKQPTTNLKKAHVYGDDKRIGFKKIEKSDRISILDSRGIMVSSVRAMPAEFTLNMPLNGVYLVKIVSKEGLTETHKVICK